MTIDERHLTTALRAYADGIDVTDEDLDRIATRMGERLDPEPRQDGSGRPWQWAVAACAVVALVLAVAALWRTREQETVPATSSITSRDLAGVWLVEAPDDVRWLWHFTADGRIAFSHNAPEYVTVGERRTPFTIQGDVLSFMDSGQRCRATMSRPSEGRLALTPLPEPVHCLVFGGSSVWELIRVSPASVAAATLVAGPHAGDQRPASEPRHMIDVTGTWLMAGTGTVLAIVRTSDREGAYVVDDEGRGVSADQRGTVHLPVGGGVVLSPRAGADQGCDTTYSRVVTTGDTLEVELADASCGRLGGAPGRWFRLN